MSERARIICIVLTILCIFAVLAERCHGQDLPDWAWDILNTPKGSYQGSLGDTYTGRVYDGGHSQSQTVIVNNQIINRNDVTVVVEEPYYYYPTNHRRYSVPRQHWRVYNQLNRP